MQTTNLGGHSGCKILLCEADDNRVFVRKIAGSKNYNARLKIQAEKQANYKSALIKTPAVLSQGLTNDGLFYFDMQYISGITLAEYVKSIEVGKIKNLVHAIVKDVVLQDSSTMTNESVFIEKIQSLKNSLSCHHNPIIDQALSMLEKHSWKKFGISACHGDLTLENIIVKDNELYLIDFLDSFYDCWILDISTLLQDVQTLWSYRFEDEININTLIRLVVFRDILMDTVREISSDNCLEVYYALLLKLIRIYPYTKDEKTYAFLDEKTQSIIDTIKQKEAI